jgi:hypothetical protein
MNTHPTDDESVFGALRESFATLDMHTPVERIEAAGHTRRRHRRLLLGSGGVAAVALVTLGVQGAGHPPTAPPTAAAGTPLHFQLDGFTVDADGHGKVDVTWDKSRYFSDPTGLQAALERAGFPVLVRTGEFCRGQSDPGTLDPHGRGPGVDAVMTGDRVSDSVVRFTFHTENMPAGQELFIGYLTPAQLQVTHGLPGSVERLVPREGPLTCTTTPPPPDLSRLAPGTSGGGAKPAA